jgi:4-aminobutyrate aminotransferase-like enzyme
MRQRNSRHTLQLLRRYESRNVTYLEPDGSWPIVWDRAQGVHVWDAEGKRYLDLTAAFGVAAAGHANSRVVAAGCSQMRTLLHAMGDVHPHRRKAELARMLSGLTFERWTRRPKAIGKTIFCNSGFEAVEAALKTARLATGKAGIIVFEGAYHGLGYGALSATHRSHFRSSFRDQLREFGTFIPFPSATQAGPGQDQTDLVQTERALQRLFRTGKFGAILVEPVQVRGGIRVPPPEFLPLLRRLCDEYRALFILDEIYTGFGRTGRWFACEHHDTVPDLICLGKALTGGFPMSACVGNAEIMDEAWPLSAGEAIHTSTFLGHPVGCAMAIANIRELETKELVERSAKLGSFLIGELSKMAAELASSFELRITTRGVGLLAGLEVQKPNGGPATTLALQSIKALLKAGFIFLPEGEDANVISFSPPLIISSKQLRSAVDALRESLIHCLNS